MIDAVFSGWVFLLDPDLNPFWRFGCVGRRCIRKHTQVHYAPTGRIAFLANGVTNIRPPRGPDVKRASPDLRFVSDPKIKKYIWPQPHWFQPGQIQMYFGLWLCLGSTIHFRDRVPILYDPKGRIPSFGNGYTNIGPPWGPDCKRAWPDLRLFAGACAKRTFVSGHFGFNQSQNPDSIGLLAPAGPNVGSTSKPTHNSGPIGA